MKWIPVLLAAALVTGCNGDGEPVVDETFPWKKRGGQVNWPPLEACTEFTSELRMLDAMSQPVTTFIQREHIRFELEVTNHSSATRKLTVGMGPQVLFEVVDADRVVAGNGLGVAWPAAVVDYVYGPGETAVLWWVWDQVMENGQQIPVGDYMVFADDHTQCRARLSKNAVLSIR